jgi:hypothetical protein
VRPLVVGISLLLAAPAALAQPVRKGAEVLWTDAGKTPTVGVTSMQAFVKLARSLGPAVVNVVATQPGEDARSALERRLARLGEIMTMDLLGTAAHEGWHQYFHWYCGSFVVLPSWINEGMGDYFYTAAPKEVRGRKMPAELGRINEGRLWVLKAAIRQNRFVPVRELLTMSKAQFYANPSVCYAEGWALCQYLLHSGNKQYEDVIPDFVRLVKNDTNFDDVREKAYKRIGLDQLEAGFKAWVEQLASPEEEQEAEPPKVEGSGDGRGDGATKG